MESRVAQEQLVWVTRTLAVNPSNIIGVFHGNRGHIEIYLPGHTRHLTEGDLTDEGRALLLPPPHVAPAGTGRPE